MRIAICTDIYLPQLSGISDAIEILARELQKRGHVVRIYAPQVSGAVSDGGVVRLHSYAIPGSGGGMVIALPFGAMKDMHLFHPDIIHTHMSSGAGLLALWGAWRLGVPCVGTDHTFPADYLRYLKLDLRPFRFLVRKFAAWYYNKCVFVTAPSKNMVDELLAYGLYRPTKVISNHIPSDLFRPLDPKADFKKKYNIGPRAILIFGRVAAEKNLDVALDAYGMVAAKTDAHLVFIGDGPYRATMEKRIREKKLETRTRFLGVLRGEVLVEAINACNIFLITSTSETQSMTALQAMACGLPVVASRRGGLPEYVHEGVNGYLVEPQDRAGFAQKILALLADEALAHRMGVAGRQSVLPFSPDAISGQFEKLYIAVVEKAKKHGF